MSQPPTGPDGFPPQPVYPSPPAAPGQQPTASQPIASQPIAPQAAPAPAGYGQSPAGPGSAPPFGGPVSAPSVPGQYPPMSAPPMSAPPFGPPMFPPPMSGPPFGPPMSALPGSVPPGSVPPYGQATPGTGKGRTVLILAIVAGLLVVLGAVMTGLFVAKNSELNRTQRQLTGQISERDATIDTKAKEIEKLKIGLQTAQDKLADVEQDLTGTRNDRDEQVRQKEVIATCLDKLTTALGAAAAGNKSAFDKANKGLEKICDEAEDYL